MMSLPAKASGDGGSGVVRQGQRKGSKKPGMFVADGLLAVA